MQLQQVKALFAAVSERLTLLTRRNAVVAKPVTVGERHIITLCELRLGFGGGGGEAREARAPSRSARGPAAAPAVRRARARWR